MSPVIWASSGHSGTLLLFEGQETADMRVVCPQDVKKTLLKQANTVYWSRKHRNVTRKLVVEGGWVRRRRLFTTLGWSDEKKCRGCNKEEGTEKHRLYHCPCWKDIRRQIPVELRKWEQRATTSKKDWKWQRGITTHPLSEGDG